MPAPVNTFIIYAREDIKIKQHLLLHLNPFRNPDYNMVIWHDEHIEAGEEWEQKIKSRLEQTDIFLMLISIHFLNSEFIRNVEFEAAIDRHRKEKSIIIPVIIKPCQWTINFYFKDYKFNLGDLQVLPDGQTSLEEWPSLESGLNKVAGGIRKVLESLQEKEQKKQADKDKSAKQQEEEINRQFAAAQLKKQQEQAEALAWETATAGNSQTHFKLYLDKFPEGRHAVEAFQQIQECKVQEKELQQAVIETQKKAWAEAREKDNLAAYIKYLNAYPAGQYSNLAADKIATLKKEAEKIKQRENHEQAEALAWETATAGNRQSYFKAYLDKFPEGTHAVEAFQRMRACKVQEEEEQQQAVIEAEKKAWAEAREKDNITAYTKYLKIYSAGQYSKLAADKIAALRKEAEKIKQQEYNAQDEKTWKDASTRNTLTAYSTYLKEHPNGNFIKEAAAKMTLLNQGEKNTAHKKTGPATGARQAAAASTAAKESQPEKKFDWWWSLLPVTVVLSILATYLGRYCIIRFYQWLDMPIQFPYISDTLLIITSCVWGLGYAIRGMADNDTAGSIIGLVQPYANISQDGNILLGLFSSPVINFIITMLVVTVVDYLLLHLFGWHNYALEVILFLIINLAAFYSYIMGD
ncbi:MAG: TIR domain-containing protein [Chitinophagaceae bacterium]